ncbi:hypothetical protein GW829_14465, partial [bacterium]|nr:hypothetical protein [bacterium]
MTKDIRPLLEIPRDRLDAINAVLLDPDSRVMNDFLAVVAKYGTPEEINRKHRESRKLDNLLKKVEAKNADYVKDLKWLMEQRDSGAFTSVAEYRTRVLGDRARGMKFADEYAVTLEVSALQYFPWIRPMCERALRDGSLVPGRFIAVRRMKE